MSLVSIVRTVLADHREAQERLALITSPWLEEFLHWGADGTLHGHLTPPDRRRWSSVTAQGWCPGLPAESVAGPRAR
jgi:hypothetical protein